MEQLQEPNTAITTLLRQLSEAVIRWEQRQEATEETLQKLVEDKT